MTLRIAEHVQVRILGGEAVMLNLSTGVYFGLDSVGTRMWQLLSKHRSTEKVIKSLLAEYEVDETQLRRDVENLIRELTDKGLVKAGAKETPPCADTGQQGSTHRRLR